MTDPLVPVPPTETAPTPPAPITDRRVQPPGVLPRGIQAWGLGGLALGMLAIMFLVGRPEPAPRAAPAPPPVAPTADRVREYQERLRQLEAQTAARPAVESDEPSGSVEARDEAPAPAPDPLAEERRRREYESLFASNIVWTSRPTTGQDDAGRTSRGFTRPDRDVDREEPAPPSVDAIADAAVRATRRATRGIRADDDRAREADTVDDDRARLPARDATDEGDRTVGRDWRRLFEGTVIDTVLLTELDGDAAGPVQCLVTNPVYAPRSADVVIPAGTRVLGTSHAVQAQGETRLGVTFHRLLLPDGHSYRLQDVPGLNQRGDVGLRDQVNTHTLGTFGAAAAVGLVTGLAQFVGTAGVGRGSGDRTVVIAGGTGEATAQATAQVMNRYLNRLPTVTIRAGHRVKVYLTRDVDLPVYVDPFAPVGQ